MRIAVTHAKGGVGATTLAVCLADVMSRNYFRGTAVVRPSGRWGDLPDCYAIAGIDQKYEMQVAGVWLCRNPFPEETFGRIVYDLDRGHQSGELGDPVFTVVVTTADTLSVEATRRALANVIRADEYPHLLAVGIRPSSTLSLEDVALALNMNSHVAVPWTRATGEAMDRGQPGMMARNMELACQHIVRMAKLHEVMG